MNKLLFELGQIIGQMDAKISELTKHSAVVSKDEMTQRLFAEELASWRNWLKRVVDDCLANN